MASEYHRGDMEIQEQVSTYHLFVGLTKWGSLGLTALLVTITLWFCTDTGFLGSFAVGFIITALGVVVLKEKGDGH